MSHLLSLALLVLCALGCQEPGMARTHSSDTALVIASSDPAIRAAQEALAQGRPWRATQILAPALEVPARRTPELVFIAARAASAWGGWTQVERLLEGAPWVDTLFEGRARTLLAEAALERRADTLAVRHAEYAIASAPTPAERGARLVFLGRALDRLDQRDSSRAAYEAAAELLPDVRDWLLLRAAGVTADSAQRVRQLRLVTLPLARERVASTDAVARERTGDIPGAIAAYEATGNRVGALRLRAVRAADDSERGIVRRELLALVRSRSGTAEARIAIEVLDASFAPLSAAEELAVARSLFRSGPAARAATAYQRSIDSPDAQAQDRFNYATLLSRLGRDAEAVRHFARVAAPRSLAAEAAYQRARSMLRAGQDGVREALRAVASQYPNDTAPASLALVLLADLATDEQRDQPARDTYRSVASRYPTSPHAPRALFQAGIIAFVARDFRAAAADFDRLRERYPRSGELPAAGYWSGRSWARAGDSARARERWREVRSSHPLSYYGMRAAHSLDTIPWSPPARADSFPALPDVDSVMQRTARLERLGMQFEANLEYDALAANLEQQPTARLLALGTAFRERGLSSRAIAVGWRLTAVGERDARAYRLAYPIVHRDLIAAESREKGLDPALVAALIRQESMFNPRATSPVGARGLMQVMPAVGRQIARGLDYPVWDDALLYQPDVNVQLGTTHMQSLFRIYDELVHSLAAYNAGGSRVNRWHTKLGVEDPEIFIERIPFVETRDYVRIVLRNREIYRSLYGWD